MVLIQHLGHVSWPPLGRNVPGNIIIVIIEFAHTLQIQVHLTLILNARPFWVPVLLLRGLEDWDVRLDIVHVKI